MAIEINTSSVSPLGRTWLFEYDHSYYVGSSFATEVLVDEQERQVAFVTTSDRFLVYQIADNGEFEERLARRDFGTRLSLGAYYNSVIRGRWPLQSTLDVDDVNTRPRPVEAPANEPEPVSVGVQVSGVTRDDHEKHVHFATTGGNVRIDGDILAPGSRDVNTTEPQVYVELVGNLPESEARALLAAVSEIWQRNLTGLSVTFEHQEG